MGKRLACRDIGVDCDFEAHGKDEGEILQKCSEHAKTSHQGMQVTPEIEAKIKAAIKDEGDSCCGS